MAVIRSTRPIPRVRGERFGGSLESGSKFEGTIVINTTGLDKLEGSLDGLTRLVPVLQEIGDRVLAVAKPPVLTGELRDSGYATVTVQENKATLHVGYSANHAAPVEFGGGGFRGPSEPRPFLRPAWEEVIGSGEARDRIASELRELWRF